MDVEQIELLPCPFCGAAGESLMVEHLEGTILHPAHQVRCDNCGASSGYTSHNFREAWNIRAALTPPEGHVVVTRNEAGQAVAVTRQDEGRILSVIAEFEPPTGYVLVPVEPTAEMISAAWRYGDGDEAPDPVYAYRAMLAARPEVK